MPDWTAPFHSPKYTTAEFEAQKAKYNAENGYTITIPGINDIITWNTREPLSAAEEKSWKAKREQDFSPERYQEIKDWKKEKRDRYLAMLGSPSPEIVRNAGAFLTSIDDAQDALTTLSVIGRLAIHYAPRLIGKAMLGPVGWIMTAADVLNLIMYIGRLGTMPMMGKKQGEAATGANPFSKKAKLKRAERLMKPWPTVGNMIEVSQTTAEVFGFGICLGPIVGAMQDVMTGAIRYGMGQPVKIKWPVPKVSPGIFPAARVPKGLTLLAGGSPILDDKTLVDVLGANYFATQELFSNSEGWNPLDAIEDIKNTEVLAPYPTNPLTLEVIEENGEQPGDRVGWPHNNQPWAKMDDIVNFYGAPANDFLRNTMQKHAHDWYGHALGNMMTDSHFYSMAALEGERNVEYNYTEQSRFQFLMLNAGLYPDPDQPVSKLNYLARIIEISESSDQHHGLETWLSFMSSNDIKVLKI